MGALIRIYRNNEAVLFLSLYMSFHKRCVVKWVLFLLSDSYSFFYVIISFTFQGFAICLKRWSQKCHNFFLILSLVIGK